MSGRAKRNVAKLNYKTVHAKGLNSKREEEEDFMSSELVGEEELLGSDMEVSDNKDSTDAEDSAEFSNDGQVSEEDVEEISEGVDPKLLDIAKQGNISRLKNILKLKNEECKKLKNEVAKVEKEALKNREIQNLLRQIKHADKTKENLQRSLASSRASTPQASPKANKQGRRKHAPPQKGKKSGSDTWSGSRKKRKDSPQEEEQEEQSKSEYQETLNSFLSLKQGNSQEYSDLVIKAVEATDNIMAIKKLREVERNNTLRGPTNNSKHESKQNRGINSKGDNASKLFEVLEHYKVETPEQEVDLDKVLNMQINLLQEMQALQGNKVNKAEAVLSVASGNSSEQVNRYKETVSDEKAVPTAIKREN